MNWSGFPYDFFLQDSLLIINNNINNNLDFINKMVWK